jgi:hypothetical protein
MKTAKMSLANVQGKLTRMEMKNIMAGVDDGDSDGEPGACVKDGEECPWTGRCCNECRPTFKCGKA